MRRRICFYCLFGLLMVIAACGTPKKQEENMENLENVEFLYDVSWDELEYTADLPAPAGKISYVMRNKMEQWYGVFVEDMSEIEYNAYMDSLYQQGFQLVTSQSDEVKEQEHVAIGTVLSNGTRGISISYADGMFGLFIRWGEI